jgi:hypothetical protein
MLIGTLLAVVVSAAILYLLSGVTYLIFGR